MGIWEEIDVEYLGRFGIPVPEDLQHQLDGKSYQETAIYFKEHFPIPDSIEKMKQDWHEMAVDKYAHEIELKPGVIHFLKQLREAGIKTGIATSNSKALVGHLADHLGLYDYIDVILTGDEVSEGKPSPEIYLKTAEKLGVDPRKCLVFEDVPAGILAGKNAGMKVCAVRDDYSRQNDIEKHQLADYYLEDYWQFVSVKIRG
jgi:16S rRNA pseudouridine516 synthase